jgi:DNA polymerase (family X)
MPAPDHNQNNQQIAALFRSIADLLASQRANPYRVRAYRRGADSLLALEEDVAEIAKRKALEDIQGVGNELSEKIEEFLRTGKIQTLEALRTPLPDQVRDWVRLPGFSESLVAYIYSRLNIATLQDLEQLVRSHMLRTIPGFSGSEEALLQAIETLRRQAHP